MKAFLKNYRQSPRKVRLVAELIKGKNVDTALVELDFLAKRGSLPVKKLLLSAIANAKQNGRDVENLFIKNIEVNKGIVMKRMMPAAMGSGHKINKRTSHIMITLGEKADKILSKKEIRKESKNQNKENKKESLVDKAVKIIKEKKVKK